MKKLTFLQQFDEVLTETAAAFGISKNAVIIERFQMFSKGRVSISKVRAYGYIKLRECVAPTNKSFEMKEELAVLRRILKSA